jgi:hypothetical protein
MAALRSLTLPLGPFFSADGKLAVGHAVACYNPGTDTLRTWYADAALTTPAPNPDRTGSDGRLAQKFLGVGPAEIRQYAPVSASSTIPDDLQDIPGAAWALVEKWLEDGLVADAGSTIYTVDTVDDLRALTDPAAIDGLVAVIGYSSASDGIGVRYYLRDQYSVASDDGGAVLNALAGGRWILKTSGGEVDARVWGVMANGADVTSNLAAAASWANANGATLYIAPGVYTVSSGSIAIANAHIADGVQIKATSGAYSVELTGHWAVDGTDALQHADSTGDVRMAFGSNADVGRVLMAWNGTDGNLGLYPGQNVLMAADTGTLTYGGSPIASLTLSKNTDIFSDDDTYEIGVLHSNGYTLTQNGNGTLVIERFDRDEGAANPAFNVSSASTYALKIASDFRTSDVGDKALRGLDGSYAHVNLHVDADRTLDNAAYIWPDVTLVPEGGKLGGYYSLNVLDVSCMQAVFADGGERVSTNTHFGVSADNFVTKNATAFESLRLSSGGSVVDLCGYTFTGFGFVNLPGVVKNGNMEFTSNGGANNEGLHEFERVSLSFADPNNTGSGFAIPAGATARFINCSISGSDTTAAITVNSTAAKASAVDFVGCTVSVGVRTNVQDGVKNCYVQAEDSTFLNDDSPKRIEVGDGSVYMDSCTIKRPMRLKGDLTDVVIVNNVYTGVSGDAIIAEQVGDLRVKSIGKIRIAGNLPEDPRASQPSTSVPRWPQTEGRIVFDGFQYSGSVPTWTADEKSAVGVLCFNPTVAGFERLQNASLVWSVHVGSSYSVGDADFLGSYPIHYDGIHVTVTLNGATQPPDGSGKMTVFFNWSN